MAESFKNRLKTGFFGDSKPGTPSKAPDVKVDYPQERDMVAPGHYAIRISGATAQTEVSINGGKWQGCRFADGYHWFDWYPEKAGTSKITARTQGSGGGWKSSAERTCVVLAPRKV